MVSLLDSRVRGLGLSPDQGHCVMFLGKTLNSHSTSVHPGVLIGSGKFNAEGNLAIETIQGYLFAVKIIGYIKYVYLEIPSSLPTR